MSTDFWSKEAARQVLEPLVHRCKSMGISGQELAEAVIQLVLSHKGIEVKPRELEAKAPSVSIPQWPAWMMTHQKEQFTHLCSLTHTPTTQVINFILQGQGEAEQRRRATRAFQRLKEKLREQSGGGEATPAAVKPEDAWRVYSREEVGGRHTKPRYLKCGGCGKFFGPSSSFEGDFEKWVNVQQKMSRDAGRDVPLCYKCLQKAKRGGE